MTLDVTKQLEMYKTKYLLHIGHYCGFCAGYVALSLLFKIFCKRNYEIGQLKDRTIGGYYWKFHSQWRNGMFPKIKQGGRTMKRVSFLLLSACMVLGMAGCARLGSRTAGQRGGKARCSIRKRRRMLPDRKRFNVLPACRRMKNYAEGMDWRRAILTGEQNRFCKGD